MRHPTPSRSRPAGKPAHTSSAAEADRRAAPLVRADRLRAMPAGDRDEAIESRLAILELFSRKSPAQVHSALRDARRAARAGARGYDPILHAALHRMAVRQEQAAKKKRRPAPP